MAKKDAKKTASDLIKLLGGESNIISYTNCMTRLRVKVKSTSKVNIDEIKKTQNVINIVQTEDQVQIILGTGFVQKVALEVGKQFPNINASKKVSESSDTNDNKKTTQSLAEVAAANKAEQKSKNTSSFQQLMSKFANIFTPLIFGFIGAGILAGVGGILQTIFTELDPGDKAKTIWTNEIAESWFQVMNVMLNMWKEAFVVIVGWRTAEIFGGSGVVGGIAATMFVPSFAHLYTAPFISRGADGFQFLGININDPLTNWLTIGFRPAAVSVDKTTVINHYTLSYASGGIFGAMFLSLLSIPVLNNIKKITPDIVYMPMAAPLTFLALIFFGYFLVVPISGIIFKAVSILFTTLSGSAVGSSVLAGIFLLAVVFGVHQGFVPVYMALVENTGLNSLYVILAMGGAAQVGVAISLYLKTEKDSTLRNQIKGAIIPGFLGIGEPLIYGVTLPRPKTFVASMLGAAVAGFYLGALSQFAGLTIGLNTVFGPSGLLGLPMITGHWNWDPDMYVGHIGEAMGLYLSGLFVGYLSGFGFMQLIGTKGVDLS